MPHRDQLPVTPTTDTHQAFIRGACITEPNEEALNAMRRREYFPNLMRELANYIQIYDTRNLLEAKLTEDRAMNTQPGAIPLYDHLIVRLKNAMYPLFELSTFQKDGCEALAHVYQTMGSPTEFLTEPLAVLEEGKTELSAQARNEICTRVGRDLMPYLPGFMNPTIPHRAGWD